MTGSGLMTVEGFDPTFSRRVLTSVRIPRGGTGPERFDHPFDDVVDWQCRARRIAIEPRSDPVDAFEDPGGARIGSIQLGGKRRKIDARRDPSRCELDPAFIAVAELDRGAVHDDQPAVRRPRVQAPSHAARPRRPARERWRGRGPGSARS